MDFKISLLLVLAAISFTNAFHSLIPEDKTLIYKYHASVDAGTHLPTPYASSFGLDGILHIQFDGNSTFMQFSDLKFKLRNGEMGDWYEIEGKELPLVKETEDFQKPFKVVHDESGKGFGIIADSKLEYVLNFQKAVGSIMQLDMKQIKLDAKKLQVFKSVENSIYGKGRAFYTVSPNEDQLHISKMLELTGSSMYQNAFVNSIPCKCGAKYDNPVTRDSQKLYKIANVDSHKVIQEVNADGGIYYHPFNGKSEGFGIYVNQTMQLLSMEAVEKKIEVADQNLHHFDYNVADFNPASPQSITHERRTWNMEKLVEKLEAMFIDSFKYLKDFHLKIDIKDIRKGHVLNDIKMLMTKLDLPSFEKLTENVLKIKTDKFRELPQIYLQMLPLIGSRDSIRHIVKMIREKKLKEHVAVDMLQNIPENVLSASKDFIAEMEEMINWGEDYSLKLRKAGIFCFSTLLSKATYRLFDPQSNPSEFILEQPDEDKYFASSKYYERYIVEFVKRMKETDDYNTQLIYIQALSNTEMVEIVEHLAPIVKGELFDHYIQILAAYAVSPFVNNNEDLLFELYWPMLVDQEQPLSNRAMIYYLIMEAQPSISRLMNIHWWFEREVGNELYRFHYTYLEALSKTTDPCRQDFKLRVSQVFRYTYKPVNGISRFALIDFVDAKYGFGKALDYFFIDSPKSSELIFKVGMTTYMNSASFNDFRVFVRIYGLEGSILKKIKMQVSKPSNQLFNYGGIINMLKNIPNNKNFKMHVILVKGDKVTMDYNVDSSNCMDVVKEFSFWLNENSNAEEKIVKFFYPFSHSMYLPTDIGFPSAYKILIPNLSHFDYIMTKETNPQFIKYHIDYIIKLWSPGMIGLSVYNPFADVWQSIKKFHSYDAAAPIMFDVYINKHQHNLKLSWTRFGNDMENHIGYRSHAEAVTLIEDDLGNKLLQECNADQKNYEIVSKGEEYRREYTLFEEEIPTTGHHHSLVAFDSERYMENTTRSNWWDNFEETILKNSGAGLQDFIVNYVGRNFYQYIQPVPLSNGFLYRFKFSTKHPSTQNDLSVRLNKEYKHGEWSLTPATKYSARLTYVLKNNNDTVMTWDMFANLDHNSGHTLSNFKAHFSKIVPNQMDFRICMEGYKKWNEQDIEGALNISTSYGTKCDDAPLLQIKMMGEQLEEQKTLRENYAECSDVIWSDMDYEHSMACYAAYSSIRKYTYTMLGSNIPVEFHKIFHSYLNKIKSSVSKHLMITTAATEKHEENNMKMVVKYPTLNEKVADVKIYTKLFDVEMNSVPVETWLKLGIHPDNLQYPKLFDFMYNSGLTETYLITNTSITDEHENTVDHAMGSEYKMCLGDGEEDSKHGVFVKKLESTGQIAVKFVHNTEHLEIVPNEGGYDFLLNGSKLDADTKTKSRDWIYFNMIESSGYINILTHHLGVFYLYDGVHLQMVIPQTDLKLHGCCIDKH